MDGREQDYLEAMMQRDFAVRRAMTTMRLAFALADASAAFAEGAVREMSDDEGDVIELHDVFAAAWSRGDSTGAAAFGDVQHGRAEIKAAYDRLLGGPFKGASATFGAQSVRILSSDYAIWQAPMEIHPAGGAAPVKGYAIDVMRKVGGRWLTLEAHPKLFPPQPPKP